MKRFVPVLFVMFAVASCTLSSCSRSCGGSWYNNRNVQITPQVDADQMTASVVDYSIICRESN